MGSGKWFFLAGIGAGAFLVLRLPEQRIKSLQDFTRKIAQSPNLNAAKHLAGERINEVLRQRGAIVVDRLAAELKRQLNAVDLSTWGTATPAASNTEDTSTTSTTSGDNPKEKDGHIIIDGTIVS